MRRFVSFFLLIMVWAGAGQAQWVSVEAAEQGRTGAQVCSEDETALCFELTCADGPLEWRLSSQSMIDMIAAPKVRAMILVGSQLAGELAFVQQTPGVFSAPLEQSHERGIARLKAGARAELRLWFDLESPPVAVRLGLRGSRKALTAAEAACAKPDFEAQEAARKTSSNPLVDIIGDMKEACEALGGELSAGDGLAEAVDLDGRDPIDMRVNHAKAECSATSSMVCGSAGCVTSLWVGQEDGTYRQVFEGNVYDLQVPQPSVITMDLHGSACGARGAAPCQKRFALVEGALIPLAE